MLTRERELQRIRYEEGKAPQPVITLNIPEAYASAERGLKTYALKDHLGSVRVSVSDVKLSDLKDDKPSNFKAEVLSIARYDAFGSPQQGRQWADKSYRYGYNGMEKDEELKGSGNSYDYGARFYDPRAGRWLSTDPKAGAFPAHSPYHFAFNNPIAFNDPDGEAPNLKLRVELQMPNGRKEVLTSEQIEGLAFCYSTPGCTTRNPLIPEAARESERSREWMLHVGDAAVGAAAIAAAVLSRGRGTIPQTGRPGGDYRITNQGGSNGGGRGRIRQW